MSLPSLNLPNVVYVGTDKAGSSWLYELCNAHPDVFVPPLKDIYFFDRHWRRGLAWYSSFFAERSAESVSIEICHDYLYSREALERIRETVPDCRILIFLREPVARTKSSYGYAQKFARRAPESLTSFADSVPSVIDNSRYAEPITDVLEVFAAEDVGVFFFEDLKASPERFAAAVCAFLGIDPPAELPGAVNAAGLPRWPMLVGAARSVGQWMRRAGLERIVGAVKNSTVVAAMKSGSRDAAWTEEDATFARSQLQDAPQEALDLLTEAGLAAGESIPDEWLVTHSRS
ncbi:MAG: hypothetical protein HKN26_03165 [Acidimicrobiales bacterium]|nr:hypothetical protein [Acidimicrobiales bacterium]